MSRISGLLIIIIDHRKAINICDNISHAFVCLPYLRKRDTLRDAPAVQKSQVLTLVLYQPIIVRNHQKKIIIINLVKKFSNLPFSSLDESDR